MRCLVQTSVSTGYIKDRNDTDTFTRLGHERLECKKNVNIHTLNPVMS